MQRLIERDYNHPSVIIWSVGNEAGEGANTHASYSFAKSRDRTRPIHYENTNLDGFSGDATDIISHMYLAASKFDEELTK